MFAWQLAKAQFIAQERGLTPFVSMQNHYNLIYREEERGTGLQIYALPSTSRITPPPLIYRDDPLLC